MARLVLSLLLLMITQSVFATDKPRMLFLTQSKGFVHGPVKRNEGERSGAELAIMQLAKDTGEFTVTCTQNAEADITPENLKKYDIVTFYTSGDLPISEENMEYFLGEWLHEKGHGFMGFHSATDTFKNYQPYWDMVGGTFAGHPWGSNTTVTMKIHDTSHPAMKPFGGDSFQFKDEIYQYDHWQPEKCHLLMSLDMELTDLKRPYHVPVAWCKEVGDGKMFYNNMGHRDDTWQNERFLASFVAAVRWIAGKEEGSGVPNPEVSAGQHKASIQYSHAAGVTMAALEAQQKAREAANAAKRAAKEKRKAAEAAAKNRTTPIHVLIWDERQPRQSKAYDNFLGNEIAEHLKSDKFEIRSVAITDNEMGLDAGNLEWAEVLVWWGHVRHSDIPHEKAQAIVEYIREGKLDLIALHSAHWARPFVEAMNWRSIEDANKKLNELTKDMNEIDIKMETVAPPRERTVPIHGAVKTPAIMGYKRSNEKYTAVLHLPYCCFPDYRPDGKPSTVKVKKSNHPIAKGLPSTFQVKQTEMYNEPFHVPEPDQVVFEETWELGERFRAGMVWNIGKGKVFYFRPGHETYPVFKQPEMIKVIENACEWLGND